MAERSERDSAVFESLGLDPQLCLDAVVVSIGDILDDAFDFALQEVLKDYSDLGGEKIEALKKGFDSLRILMKSFTDKKVETWEKFCLYQVFQLPEDFALPKENEPKELLSFEEVINDPDLDNELDSLRRKLTAAGKEQAQLKKELSLIEKKSNFSTDFKASINEILSSLEDPGVKEAYQDILITFPKLQKKVLEMLNESNGPSCLKESQDFSVRLEQIEGILGILEERQAQKQN